jgi:hypothetical protein
MPMIILKGGKTMKVLVIFWSLVSVVLVYVLRDQGIFPSWSTYPTLFLAGASIGLALKKIKDEF